MKTKEAFFYGTGQGEGRLGKEREAALNSEEAEGALDDFEAGFLRGYEREAARRMEEA